MLRPLMLLPAVNTNRTDPQSLKFFCQFYRVVQVVQKSASILYYGNSTGENVSCL